MRISLEITSTTAPYNVIEKEFCFYFVYNFRNYLVHGSSVRIYFHPDDGSLKLSFDGVV